MGLHDALCDQLAAVRSAAIGFFRHRPLTAGRGDRALLALAITVYLPFALAGPGFFIDDWFALRNGALDEWWMSAGEAQWKARPVAAAIYAVTFGLIGERPLVHFVLASLTMAASALILHHVARRFLPAGAAFGLAAVWLVVPTHTSLEMWPSCFNIAVALLLLLAGAERVTRPVPSRRDDLVAAVMFAVATLAYEAVAPAAGAVVLVAALHRRRRIVPAAAPAAVAIGAAGAWMVLQWHPDKQGLDATLDPTAVIPAHFGETITGDAVLAELLIVVAVLLGSLFAAWGLVDAQRRASLGWPGWAVVIGWALIALGTMPFVRYFYSPLGLGDRVLVVSGLGGAIVLVAVAGMLDQRSRVLAASFVLVLIGSAIVQRASMASEYAIAADDGRRIRAAVRDRWPEPPDVAVVLGPQPIVERNVVAFFDVDSAIQLLYDDPTVKARMTGDEEDFYAVPVAQRIDIRRWSRLDDDRLGRP